MRYYSITFDDLNGDDDWSLSIEADKAPIDVWTGSIAGEPAEVRLLISKPGIPVDFDIMEWAIPVCSKRFVDAIRAVAPNDFELVTANVVGDETQWYLLNTLRIIDCIDHARSYMTYYPDDDPDHPGQPRGVIDLVLDESRIGGFHIFRPKDWEVELIVSEVLKDAMEAVGITGAEFQPISTS